MFENVHSYENILFTNLSDKGQNIFTDQSTGHGSFHGNKKQTAHKNTSELTEPTSMYIYVI